MQPAVPGRLNARWRAAGKVVADLKWARDPVRLSLFAFVVVTVSRLHQYVGAVAKLHPPLLFFAIAAGWAVLNPRLLSWGKAMKRWPFKVLIALGVLACLSALFGISLGHSAVFILNDYSKTLIATLLLMAILQKGRDVSMLVWAYVIACLILALVAVFMFRLVSAGGGISRLAELETYDANDLGVVVVAGVPLTLLTLTTSGRLGRLFSLGVLAAIGVTIARTGSRGAFVGLLVVGLLLVVWLRQFALWKRLAFVAVTGVAIAVAAPAGYWAQMRTIFSPEQDYNWTAVNGRKAIALRAWGYFKAYPVFGLGINNFQMAEGTISPMALSYARGQPGIKWSAAHNSFLQVGTEMGPIGLALWAGLVIGGIVGMRRLRRRLPRQWAKGDREQRFIVAATLYLPIALAGFAVSSAFVSFAYLDPIYLLAAYVTGIYACAEQRLRQEQAATGPRLGPRPPGAVLRGMPRGGGGAPRFPRG